MCTYCLVAIVQKDMQLYIISIIISFILVFNAGATQKRLEKSNIVTTTDTVSFSYSEISGIGYDTDYNRRDNSDIIKVGKKYYVWYTKMISPETAGYWGTIWYAISEDEGHTWKEQGMALGLGNEGEFDSQSVFTPNILAYKGKYFLYYTGVKPTPGCVDKKFENNSVNDFTAIGLAVSDNPDGPFVRAKTNPVLTISNDSADFDSYRVDDAALLVRNQKIWLFYKGRSIIYGKNGPSFTKMGVAHARNPEGSFVKYNEPILDKSHEVLIWKQNGGVAALASISSSIQFASDGLNFAPNQKKLTEKPLAPGLYRPDLENGNKSTKNPDWGISMVQKKGKTYLVRFEM